MGVVDNTEKNTRSLGNVGLEAEGQSRWDDREKNKELHRIVGKTHEQN